MNFKEFVAQEAALDREVANNLRPGRGLPSDLFKQVVNSLYQHQTEPAWNALYQVLEKMGKSQEAKAIQVAHKTGRVVVNLDGQKFLVRGLTPTWEAAKFAFEPRTDATVEADRNVAVYSNMWKEYGPPVRVVGTSTYWSWADGQHEKRPYQQYGIYIPAEAW